MSKKEAQQKKREELRKKLKKSIEELEPKERKKLRAIAVKYDAKKGTAPQIIATGKGLIAEEILKVAEEHKVPLFEDETLSNLLDKLELDDEIPGELYNIVAEILAFVYQLDKMSKKRTKIRQKFSKAKRRK